MSKAPDSALASTSAAANAPTWRNGYRERALDKNYNLRLGTLNLRVPKLASRQLTSRAFSKRARILGTGAGGRHPGGVDPVVSRPVASMSWCRPWG